MSHEGGAAVDTWPFWAPSEAASVQAALDLAGLAPGETLVDLGCGDGQVLLAAARRGARVCGIEADAALAAEARGHLAAAGVDAAVLVADLLDAGLDVEADVYFTYLAPATLQRLVPSLGRRRGARLVTVDFGVPGLVPSRRDGPARLYRLPGRRRPVGRPGWPTAGTLVATVPDRQSLTCLELVHPGGPTDARLGGSVADVAAVLAGADELAVPGHLAVDLRWEPMAAGTVVGGVVRSAGVDDHAVFVIATDDDEGVWDLDDDAVGSLRAAVQSQPRSTLAELLDATATGGDSS